MDVASRRILRMAVGTALGMWISQAVAWPMSFVAPLLAFVLLSLPLPARRQDGARIRSGSRCFVIRRVVLLLSCSTPVGRDRSVRPRSVHTFYITAKGARRPWAPS